MLCQKCKYFVHSKECSFDVLGDRISKYTVQIVAICHTFLIFFSKNKKCDLQKSEIQRHLL